MKQEENKKIKILFIINGLGFANNPGIGGGDKRFIEIIRHASQAKNIQLHIQTSETGAKIFTEDEKLYTTYRIVRRPHWWPAKINDYVIARIASYIYVTVHSIKGLINQSTEYDLVVATSDNFFDIVPGLIYKLIHKKKLVCMVHHIIPHPFKRKSGIVTNILLYLSQRFHFLLIARFADKILVYATPEGKEISKRFMKNKISFVHNGIDTNRIDAVPTQRKIYDGCFVGGLRKSKGIFDLPIIWKEVVKKYPKAKLAVVGGYSDRKIFENFKFQISNFKLENNVIMFGPLPPEEVYKTMKASRFFLFPSYEEGWGIAVCEALYCGLQVLAYELPAYAIFHTALRGSPIGQHSFLTKKILRLLTSKNFKNKTGKKIAKQFSWDEISSQEIMIYTDLLKK